MPSLDSTPSATHRRLATLAADLVADAQAVPPELTNQELWDLLQGRKDLDAVAVVEEGRPIGLVNRNIFMEAYARPFSREVFGRRSCIAWMDKQPLVVDVGMRIEQVVAEAVRAGAKVLKDGFVGVRGGRYAGLGSGFALLEAMSALERVKADQIMDSIDYASRIQRAHLAASDAALQTALPDHALVWEPRDVVGGDCYFFRPVAEGLFGAVIDCTGHGVPGAFMSLIALSFLDHAVAPGGPAPAPGEVLAGLNRHIHAALGRGGAPGATRQDDGLDGACFLVPREGPGAFASARIPAAIVPPEGEPIVLEGERESVGYPDTPLDRSWATRELPLVPGALLVVFTDGVVDQVGGPKGIAHGRRRAIEAVVNARAGSAREIADAFRAAFAGWQGAGARRDDLTFLVARRAVRP